MCQSGCVPQTCPTFYLLHQRPQKLSPAIQLSSLFRGPVSFCLVCFALGDFCLMTKTIPFSSSLWLGHTSCLGAETPGAVDTQSFAACGRHWLRAICSEVSCGVGVRSGPVQTKVTNLASVLVCLLHCKMRKNLNDGVMKEKDLQLWG